MTSTTVEGARAPSAAYRWYVLVLLTFVYTFNFIDRQIIGILSPAIKADLGLDDWQLGILKGFAFAILYTTLGIPIARLADRMNRVTIVSVSLALWSGFTAISGLAQNFAQLALARVGVGIGEAGGSPPSHSLLSDYFPKEKRAGALAFYAMGIPIGIALAYLGGGWLTQTFSWRVAFFVVGLPGIALAILLRLTVREQPRGALDGAAAEEAAARAAEKQSKQTLLQEVAAIWQAAKHLFAIPTYRGIVIATTAVSFTAYAISTWIVDFYSRTHADFSILQVYFWLGIISGTAYVAGTFLGGHLVDKFAAKDKRMYGYIPAMALALGPPLLMLSIWVESPVLSLVFQAPLNLVLGFYLGPAFAMAQTLAPIRVRALSTAIFFFVLNLIALGFGPTTAGFLSSLLTPQFGEELALKLSLSIVAVGAVYGAWKFYKTGALVPADWAKVESEQTKRG